LAARHTANSISIFTNCYSWNGYYKASNFLQIITAFTAIGSEKL